MSGIEKEGPRAWLSEMFVSVQGEGPLVGVRQLFVRFQDCHRHCAFCDSAAARGRQPPAVFAFEPAAGQSGARRRPNPVRPADLARLCAELAGPRGRLHSISLTGGEPLRQAAFLRAVLPRLRRRGWKIHLETAGDRVRDLTRVLPWIDYVAMDIKLPSVTGERGRWRAHRRFLERCLQAGCATAVKVVVSRQTREAEWLRAAALVAGVAPRVTLVLQPVTPVGRAAAPRPEQLLRWQALALAAGLRDVRVIPQCHKLMDQR
ncbi:MAG: 7-carboxy-7-deazaguanine synthase QueE [Kiritimatiellaeota bacterium]|nr:7-carboxy-7-deazaguanine synthase QueE [Kiritimatiellota bacterium]